MMPPQDHRKPCGCECLPQCTSITVQRNVTAVCKPYIERLRIIICTISCLHGMQLFIKLKYSGTSSLQIPLGQLHV